MATYRQDRPGDTGSGYRTGPSMVRWGAVLAGSVIGVGLLLLFSSLWVAWGQETTAIADNIEWFTMVTAVVSLFLAGLIAGWLSGVRGWGPGLAHGLTVWGGVITAILIVGSPQAVDTLEPIGAVDEFAEEFTQGALWATFLGLAIGLAAAIIGGALGGGIPRPRAFFETFGDDRPGRSRDYDYEDAEMRRESPVVEGSARSHVEQRQPQAQPQQGRSTQQPTTRRR